MPSNRENILSPRRVAEAAQLPRTSDGVVDWFVLDTWLQAREAEETTDDLIDAVAEAVLSGELGSEAVPSLTKAVRWARSDLSRRSAALALAITASPDDMGAVDALTEAYMSNEDHPFIAPAVLEALGLLALKGSLARAQLSTLLLRLTRDRERYVLIKASKVIGRMDALKSDLDLRTKLVEFAAAGDPAVRAEARQQLALIELGDALLSTDRQELQARLISARAAFKRAERSEEVRPDATMFVHLLDMVLAFENTRPDQVAVAERVAVTAEQPNATLYGVVLHDGRGYHSDRAALLVQRVLSISDALRRASDAVTEVEEWTNLGVALENLARLYAQVRGESISVLGQDGLAKALGRLSEGIFAATLGPLLLRSVGQRRLARVREEYVLRYGEDPISRGLLALEEAAISAGKEPSAEGLVDQLSGLAGRVNRDPQTLLTEFIEAADQNRLPRWVEQIGLAGPLHLEKPDLYGNDPAIDETIRPLLRQLAVQLKNYSPLSWGRLAEILTSLIGFVDRVRDEMPPYTLCEEDGGLGQRASEADLQKELYAQLRQQFGKNVFYELPFTAGGRADLYVQFSEARFPIEIKHEFSSIASDHIRNNFLLQPDAYAATTSGVCFLLILDLRSANAAGHQARIKSVRKAGEVKLPSSLYALRDSFWAESLPPDTDLVISRPNVVIVGLVPGNRPRPSSMSKYSRRPTSVRRRGGKGV